MPTIAISESIVAYNDSSVNSNPQYVFFSWRRQVPPTSVKNPLETQYVIQPNSSQIVFSGTRSTAIDGTTTFSIALNPINSSVYRITATGGTAPGFRTDRNVVVSGDTLALVINNNATLAATLTTGAFTGVVVGDTVFIPTNATGDAAVSSPFNGSNGGYWTVLAKSSDSKTLTLARLPGQSFSGVSETVSPTSNAQFVVFSNTGVQVGDALEISAGFSPITQMTVSITGVTPNWVEFSSTISLPLETGIQPGATGLTFYLANKQYVRIEVDQEVAVRFNGAVGSSDQNVRVVPRTVADANGIGWIEKWGTTYALEIFNRSRNMPVTVTILSAE